MPVSQAQFDADLNDLVTAITALINNPAVVDLSSEDATVKGQIDAINSHLPPTPQPPPGP